MKTKFVYYTNSSVKKKKVEVDLPDESFTPNLTPLNDKTLISTPEYQWMSGGTHHHSSNWHLVIGDTKTKLFHERACFPYNFLKETIIEYWVDEKSYLKPKEAAIDLHSRGCDLSKWVAIQEPYSDDEIYFIQTKDFDEALKYLGYKHVEIKD